MAENERPDFSYGFQNVAEMKFELNNPALKVHNTIRHIHIILGMPLIQTSSTAIKRHPIKG